MVWQIKAFSRRCCVSGEALSAGEQYVSYLVVDDQNELQRFDVSADNDDSFEPQGELLCRWRQVYKKEPEKDDSARKQRDTAEGLFLSLYDGDGSDPEVPEEENGDLGKETGIMKQFLGLMLERKRVLKFRGMSPDGLFRLMEHLPSKSVFPVPAGTIGQEELLRIADRLNTLVG